MRRFLAVLALLAAFAAQGCGLIDYYFLPPPEDTAQELYESGMDAMSEHRYSDAQDYFTKLKDRYPFSPYTADAEISLGDAYFLDADYEQAAEAYKEFELLHPGHERIVYVLFMIGQSDFYQSETIDKRQKPVEEALEYFYRVRDAYPGTPEAAAAPEWIRKSRTRLAEHELFVAEVYWRTEKFGPAYHRFRYVYENFPDLPALRDYAQRMAEYAYFEYQKYLSEEERRDREGHWTRWFNWL